MSRKRAKPSVPTDELPVGVPVAPTPQPQEQATKAPEPRKLIYTRPKLYAAQHAAFYGPTRYITTEGTTKSGKTRGAATWLAEQAILATQPGRHYWWVAPVNPVAAIAYRRMAKAIPYELRTTHDTDKRITLVNGSTLWFKSGEKPDNLYGEDVVAAVIDEASRLREESWHALRTTLSATKGKCRMIGNVKGRRNWFYRLCRKAEAGEKDMAYCKLTWREAVTAGILDEAEVEDARRMLPPAVFQELYEAEAADDQGNPFGMQAIKECVRPMSTDPVVCWGIDIARKHDWFVLVGLDRLKRMAGFERFQLPWREAIRRAADIIGNTPALADDTGVGDPVVEFLQGLRPAVTGYTFTPRSKQQLMEGLAIEVQQRKIGFLDGVVRDEMEGFEYAYTRTGVQYAAPEGCYDDCVCALALASFHHKGHDGNFHYEVPPQVKARSEEWAWRGREILV